MNKKHKKKHYCHDSLVKLFKKGHLHLPEGYQIPQHHGHDDTFTTVREATYRGKAIRIETTYKIAIDDNAVKTHTIVLDDGSVHCHSFPNYSFPSAMDLARKFVDSSVLPEPRNELGDLISDDHGGHNR